MRRSSQILLRVTPDEACAITAKAASLGLNRSEFLRLAAALPIDYFDQDSPPENPRRVVLIDRDSWMRIARESTRWGTNYNQGVRALNTIARAYAHPPKSPRAWQEVLDLSAKSLKRLRQAKEGMDTAAALASEIRANVLLPAPSARAHYYDTGWQP